MKLKMSSRNTSAPEEISALAQAIRRIKKTIRAKDERKRPHQDAAVPYSDSSEMLRVLPAT
jgi:hypothetical protein